MADWKQGEALTEVDRQTEISAFCSYAVIELGFVKEVRDQICVYCLKT